MAHIKVEEGVPGIRSLVLFRPETGQYLYELVQTLLRGESSLSEAERELIAAYVSHRNDCMFCRNSHAAASRCLFDSEKNLVDETLNEIHTANVSNKMKALPPPAASYRAILLSAYPIHFAYNPLPCHNSDQHTLLQPAGFFPPAGSRYKGSQTRICIGVGMGMLGTAPMVSPQGKPRYTGTVFGSSLNNHGMPCLCSS